MEDREQSSLWTGLGFESTLNAAVEEGLIFTCLSPVMHGSHARAYSLLCCNARIIDLLLLLPMLSYQRTSLASEICKLLLCVHSE